MDRKMAFGLIYFTIYLEMNGNRPELKTESGISLREMSNRVDEENRKKSHVHCSKKNPLIIGNRVFNSITDFDLSEKEIDKARVELGETEEVKRSCLRELKRKLSNDGHERCRLEDAHLLSFLRARKFDCKKVYSCLKKKYDIKKNHPEIFNIPSNLKSLLDVKAVTVLPYTEEDGRILFWMDIGKWKPEDVSTEEFLGVALCICRIICMNPKCQVNGISGIWDAKELNISHFSHIVKWLQIIMLLMLNCYPWRIKNVFIMNTGQLTRLIYNIARPFLSKKIKERVFLLGSDFGVLHKYVNPQILPKKFGGKLEEEECSISQLVLENISLLEH